MAKASTPTPETSAAPEPQVGPPTVEQVAKALGKKSADVAEAYAAERAAQSSVCHVPGSTEPWPTELTEALTKRVPVALRNGLRRGSSDSEVKSLEAPHRKRVNKTDPTTERN